jgi:hypothetical protein
MLTQGYSDADLEQLTSKARTLWEYDFHSSPKKIKRRANVVSAQVPLQAIYRMVVEDWSKAEFNCYHFPFSISSFARVFGLGERWDIPIDDRRYVEKDMVLFPSDGRTILILPGKFVTGGRRRGLTCHHSHLVYLGCSLGSSSEANCRTFNPAALVARRYAIKLRSAIC